MAEEFFEHVGGAATLTAPFEVRPGGLIVDPLVAREQIAKETAAAQEAAATGASSATTATCGGDASGRTATNSSDARGTGTGGNIITPHLRNLRPVFMQPKNSLPPA
jgi:hypothetical protein